jgi:phosphohistidine phosphatase
MQLFLVHHGDAVGPDVDPQRPLSRLGQQHVVRAAEAAAAHATRPAVIWHSGKLRARQTAEAFLLVCHPFAGFFATDDLQPDSSPQLMRDRLRGETRDVMIVGHFPHLPRLLRLLLADPDDSSGEFPPHGVVALSSDDEGQTWKETWRWDGLRTVPSA